MPRADFTRELTSLGYKPQDLGEGKVAFPYTIEVGRYAGQTIQLGFVAQDDYNLNPPSGPHIKPRLLPLKGGGQQPDDGIHDSPFGSDWQYWSRPIKHWGTTKRTARDVMAHIRRVLDQLR